MTVLERLKAAGYDPAVSLFPDSIGNAGSMECERIQIRTFFCRPRENEAAIGSPSSRRAWIEIGLTMCGIRHRGDCNRDDPLFRRLDPSVSGRLAA